MNRFSWLARSAAEEPAGTRGGSSILGSAALGYGAATEREARVPLLLIGNWRFLSDRQHAIDLYGAERR